MNEQNNALPETTVQEYNEKQINLIYLESLAKPAVVDTTITALDTTLLGNISNVSNIATNFLAVSNETPVFTAAQQAQLLNIARQCPYSGGEAVYLARSLCAQFTNEYYNDKAICNAVGIQARHSKPKEEISKKNRSGIKIYPNPSKERIYIASDKTYENVTITLTSVPF